MPETLQFRFGSWLSEAWKLFASAWSTWVMMVFLYMIPLLFVYLLVIFFVAGSANFNDIATVLQQLGDQGMDTLVFRVLLVLGITVINSLFIGGMYHAAFKQIRGEKIQIEDLFAVFNRYPDILVFSFILAAADFMIQFLMVTKIPGIQILVILLSTVMHAYLILGIPEIISTESGAVEAIQNSIRITSAQIGSFIILTLIAMYALPFAGALACCVGIFAAVPVSLIMISLAYRDLVHPEIKPMSAVEELYSKSCIQCGASIDVKSVFCEHCGTKQV